MVHQWEDFLIFCRRLLFRLLALWRRSLLNIFRLGQQFELDFPRARAHGFVSIVADKFLERAAQDVVTVVALGFARTSAEFAGEFIPDAMQRARRKRDVVALNVGFEEKLVEKDTVVAVRLAHA